MLSLLTLHSMTVSSVQSIVPSPLDPLPCQLQHKTNKLCHFFGLFSVATGTNLMTTYISAFKFSICIYDYSVILPHSYAAAFSFPSQIFLNPILFILRKWSWKGTVMLGFMIPTLQYAYAPFQSYREEHSYFVRLLFLSSSIFFEFLSKPLFSLSWHLLSTCIICSNQLHIFKYPFLNLCLLLDLTGQLSKDYTGCAHFSSPDSQPENPDG